MFKIPNPFLLMLLAAAAPAAVLHADAVAVPKAPAEPPAAVMHDDGRTAVMSNLYVGPDEVIDGDAVVTMGNATIDGTVTGEARAVMGNLTINGTVDKDATSVMGNLTVNGTVGGDAVSTMGTVTLGPRGKVLGKVVAPMGSVDRREGGIVRGGIQRGPGSDWKRSDDHRSFPPFVLLDRLHDGFFGPFARQWLRFRCWRLWAAGLIVLSALVALIAPGAVRHTGDQLVHRPWLVVLSSLLFVPALPVVVVLLCITLVGVLFVPFVVLSVIFLAFFGKGSIYARIGRSIAGDRIHPAAAVLLGGLICMLVYLVPYLGFLCSVCLTFLGFGCAFTALFPSSRPGAALPAGGAPAAPAPLPTVPPAQAPMPVVQPVAPPTQAVPVAALAAPPAPAISAGSLSPAPQTAGPPPVPPPPTAPAAPAAPSVQPPPAAMPPLPVNGDAQPRAGFWIRMGALVIDAVLLVIFAHWWILAIAIYGAVMWKLKGSTVGGLIFGLKVVRLDGKPLEWDTAIVRAVSCYLSAAVLFLGFLWIAFDDEKQAWHDKIAGTVVARVKERSPV